MVCLLHFYQSFLIRDKTCIKIRSFEDDEFVATLEEQFEFKKYFWNYNSSTLITITNHSLWISFYNLISGKMYYCQDCINSANCYSISNTQKLMAVIQSIKDKHYIEIFDLENFSSITHFNIQMKNPHRIEWGQNDMYIMVSEQFFDNKLNFYLLNGNLIQEFNRTQIQFDKYYLGELKERGVFVSTLGDIILFNLKFIQPIKTINSKKLIEKNQDILKEIEDLNNKHALEKRRKFIKSNYCFQKKYEYLEINLLKISVIDELFAVVFKQYPELLIIYDMINLSIKVIIQFINPIRDYEWNLHHDLIIITGEFCFYIWSNDDMGKMKIMEHFYKGEFQAKKLKCYKQKQIYFFQSLKEKKRYNSQIRIKIKYRELRKYI